MNGRCASLLTPQKCGEYRRPTQENRTREVAPIDYLINGFIFIYILFAALWDSPESNLVDRKLRSLIRGAVIKLGLSHRWNMYTGPFAEVIEIEARVSYEDGSTKLIPLPARYEFRRYAFMLGHRGRNDLYRAFADCLLPQLPESESRPIEIIIVRRVAQAPCRASFWGRFDTRVPRSFRESIVARRTLR